MADSQYLNEEDKNKLNSLKSLLSDQENKLKNETREVERERESAKTRVTEGFARLEECVRNKKAELLQKIETDYTDFASYLDNLVRGVRNDEQKIDEVLADCSEAAEGGRELDISDLKNGLETSIEFLENAIPQFRPPYLVMNERAVDTVVDLKFAELKDAITSRNYLLASNSVNELAQNTAIDNSDTSSNESTNNQQDSTTAVENETLTSATVSATVLNPGGATGVTRPPVVPTAPPANPEAPPPTYWQAVGGAQGGAPLLPDNQLELWLSFSMKQHEQRLPVPIAVTWNGGRICLLDKANAKVEIFCPNGDIMSKLNFEGSKLRDIAFLDSSYGISRYILSTYKSKTLTMISVDGRDHAKVSRLMKTFEEYSCICRGPRPQTLVGAAKTTSSLNPLVVQMFLFDGQVHLTIPHSPNFVPWKHIKSVQVFGSNIIILDWKLNIVAIYQEDGAAIGEYTGTDQSPLINPSDMTLDNNGNILILNGEFQNIHLIDLKCQPLQVIEIPKDPNSTTRTRNVLIAFDVETQKLCIVKSNGDVLVYTFTSGYECYQPLAGEVPQLLIPHQNMTHNRQKTPEVLPLVDGVLPRVLPRKFVR